MILINFLIPFTFAGSNRLPRQIFVGLHKIFNIAQHQKIKDVQEEGPP